jgi:ABC-type sugar transport system permease subunit
VIEDRATSVRAGRGGEVVAAAILAAALWAGFASTGSPRVVPATAPPSAFSAERAMADLRVIAAAPHAVGTAQHDRIRDYLVDRLRALGCGDAHVQSGTGFNTLSGPLAATIANVVCRIRGTPGAPAILLTAHYDAVPRGPGAGDDAVGVATILETVRAMQSSPPLPRDVIVLFSDAEEEGLLGAEAFVNLHPWAKDVGTVLNLDTRGDRGPVYMFQTSPGNAPLIAAIATSVDDARTNSLTGEVYRHLQSDTDMSIWLDSAFPVGALNFANIDGFTHYHTPIDDITSLDPRVVQQMGDYAIGLVRQLAIDRGPERTHDAIYFSAPLLGVVHYPASLAVPIAIVELLGLLILAALAVRRGSLSARGTGLGAILVAMIVIVPAVATAIAWRAILHVHSGYAEILQGDPYNSRWYLLACAGWTTTIAIALARRFERRATPLELSAVALFLWAIVGIAAAFLLPGATYIFALPLAAAMIGAACWLHARSRNRQPPAAIALAAVPALILWPPTIHALEVALTANLLTFCAALIGLMMSLLILPIALLGRSRSWIVAAAAIACVGGLVIAEARSGFTATRKQPDSLLFLHDATTGHQWWASFDRRADQWTTPILGPTPTRRTFDDWSLARPGIQLLAREGAPVAPDTAFPGSVLSSAVPGGRRIHMHLAQHAPGESVKIVVDTSVGITDMTINGRVLVNGGDARYRPSYRRGADGTLLRYFGVPQEGVDLWFTAHSPMPARFTIISSVDGLPPPSAGPLPPRPATLMSKPFVPTDVTLTRHTATL